MKAEQNAQAAATRASGDWMFGNVSDAIGLWWCVVCVEKIAKKRKCVLALI